MTDFRLRPEQILYEDNHLLVVNKPVGLATMGLPDGETTLLTLAKDYIRQKYAKPGNVYLGVVSRLDVPVSGVVVFARTSKSADRLNEQFRTHSAVKIYQAVVQGKVADAKRTLTDWIAEDARHRKVSIVSNPKKNSEKRFDDTGAKKRRFDSENFRQNIRQNFRQNSRFSRNPCSSEKFCDSCKTGENSSNDRCSKQEGSAKEARLHFRRLAFCGSNTLLEIQLETGRKHQIRLQLSHFGHPILGDNKYGAPLVRSESKIPIGIALHARSLTILHPTTGEVLTFTAPIPTQWKRWGYRNSSSCEQS